MSDQNWFVDIPIEVSAEDMADDAVDNLQQTWDGWEPAEGDAEVILIETLAPLAESAARAVSVVLPAIFRSYGTKLLNVVYVDGAPAQTTITIQLVDTDVHQLDEGSEFEIDGVAFSTNADISNAAGTDVLAGVEVFATEDGTVHNGLTGVTTSPISAMAFVESFTVDTPTAGGIDPQDDLDYQSDLSQQLQLQAKTLVTARDYELWALSYPDIAGAYAENLGARQIRVTVRDADGNPVSPLTKTALGLDYANFQIANNTNMIADPTYTTISVTYTVVALPGYAPADLGSRIDAMLSEFLSPARWGRPEFGDPGSTVGWINDSIVYKNVIIDQVADVEGVRRVVDVTIAGDNGAATAAGDWTMVGTVALPRPGVSAGTVLVS
jgi:hypothetical protein